MADIYVSHLGDNSTGAAWTTAKTTFQAGLTAAGVGGTIYVASDHTEAAATALLTLTAPGSVSSPNRIFCVAKSTPVTSADLVTVPTVNFSTTGAFNIVLAGVVSICHGLIFTVSDAANNATFAPSGMWNLNKCALRLGTSFAGSTLRTPSAQRVVWTDTTVQFGAASQAIQISGTGELIWRSSGGSYPSTITGATIPNQLFGAGSIGIATLEGVDLSPLTPSKNILNYQTSAKTSIMLKDCTLPASMPNVITGTPSINGTEVIVVSSNSGAVNTTQARYDFFGAQADELTIVRTGGANDGTSAMAWKFSPSANCKPDNALTSLPIMIWNEAVGSAKTVTVYGYCSIASPTQDDCWIEVEYHSSTTSPIGSFVATAKADPLATASALASDTSTWGGSSTTKFKMVTPSFTPQMKGYFTIRVRIGAAAGTFYIDPKPVIT